MHRRVRTVLATTAASILALFGGLAAHAATAPACAPIAGLDAVLKTPSPIIWLGEIHGTKEMPALFGDAVCAASLGTRPVIVALERTAAEQAEWDTYLQSDGSLMARSQFLLGQQWTSPGQDGRSSKAMQALAEQIRVLKQAGRIQSVALFDSYSPDKPRDQSMADNLAALVKAHTGAVILALSGNIHNMRVRFGSQIPALSLLPLGTATSIDMVSDGGQFWNGSLKDAGTGGVPHAPGIVPARDTSPDLAQRYDWIAYLGKPTTASPPALAEALALAAPVHTAFVKAETEQAKLPPARNDSERLKRIFDLDQAGRNVIIHIDFSTLPPDQTLAGQKLAAADINAHDLADQKALKVMMPATGWFTKPPYSGKAVDAAFLIVQHAVNDPDLMRDALKRMEPLVKTGQARGDSYALLYDRVALHFDHKPQRYGSQMECRNGKWQPQDMEDPSHVDERRKAMGFSDTEAEYVESFATWPCQ